MDLLNSIHVVMSNAFCRLSTWKRPDAVAAVALGYGYDIEDDDE